MSHVEEASNRSSEANVLDDMISHGLIPGIFDSEDGSTRAEVRSFDQDGRLGQIVSLVQYFAGGYKDYTICNIVFNESRYLPENVDVTYSRLNKEISGFTPQFGVYSLGSGTNTISFSQVMGALEIVKGLQPIIDPEITN
jgi:hypothetical protein